MSARPLTQGEIAALERQGCRAADWRTVRVSDPFEPERIREVAFSGSVSIGRQSGRSVLPGGVEEPCGLHRSRIHNCSFGDDVLIDDVGTLANYDLEEGVAVRNVRTLAVEGESCFGNGTRLAILNESGGRELPICDRLSAQVAYLLVMYRHDPKLVRALEALIEEYAGSKRSARGRIQRGSRILESGRLLNLAVGPAATVQGALELEEGTIASHPEAPTRVGPGVIARGFILLSGSSVDSGTILERCFVGQGVRLGRQFSAENCAFFANCEGFHSEAVSLFAGPYTVTHHRSTLLIAACISFFNAGSGTNQSNHMYKLGPVHQGILERGVKTGSFAYLAWPARVGPFTTVTGKHGGSLDTSEFPFSNLADKQEASVLTPAVNLLNMGTRRDADKWRARDRRKGPDKLDRVHFELFNPYIVGRMMRGRAVLQGLAEKSSKDQGTVLYKGVQIRRLMLRTTVRYYDMAVDAYLSDRLAARLEPLCGRGDMPGVHRALAPPAEGSAGPADQRAGDGPWRDLAGLLAPDREVEELAAAVSGGDIRNLEGLHRRFQELHERYPVAEWAWCGPRVEERWGIRLQTAGAQELARVIQDGSAAALKLNSMLAGDAGKEFDEHSRIGYGIDGSAEERDLDFDAVRGRPEDSAFVQEILEESQRIEERRDRLVGWLAGLEGR
ncbi:MAG: DUF4954 family protein [Spirochaetales bacterium]|nr:DUF4954 family protein [Spirochaetales bacterium]